MRYLMLLVFCSVLVAPQDPERPKPPPDAAPLPPVQEPFRSKVERRDLIQEFTRASPIEGFYRLRRVVRPGQGLPRVEGYLWIGRRHLMLQLSGNTGNPRLPALQTGVRAYRTNGDTLVMTAMLGFRNDADGDIHLDATGATIERRFELVGPLLRIHEDDNSQLEFERVE